MQRTEGAECVSLMTNSLFNERLNFGLKLFLQTELAIFISTYHSEAIGSQFVGLVSSQNCQKYQFKSCYNRKSLCVILQDIQITTQQYNRSTKHVTDDVPSRNVSINISAHKID